MHRAENLVRATDLSRTDRFWNEAAETMPEGALRAHQERGLAEVWHRIWDEPIPFYTRRYSDAGLHSGEVPDLDAAIALAKKVPLGRNGAIEIRPLIPMPAGMTR